MPVVLCSDFWGMYCVKRDGGVGILFNRVGAVLAAAAFWAVFASPYAVEMLHGGFDKLRIVGEYSGLEVAAGWTFHAHTGSC